MQLETTEELCHQIADWIGVYGGCKANECENGCENMNPLCCRQGFMMQMQERMKQAVKNEEAIDALQSRGVPLGLTS